MTEEDYKKHCTDLAARVLADKGLTIDDIVTQLVPGHADNTIVRNALKTTGGNRLRTFDAEMHKAIKQQPHRDKAVTELGRMPANPTDLVDLFAENRKLNVRVDGMIVDGQSDGLPKFTSLDDMTRLIRVISANLGLRMRPLDIADASIVWHKQKVENAIDAMRDSIARSPNAISGPIVFEHLREI